jgi:hypothetical protein
MATINPVVTGAPYNDDGSVKIIRWEELGEADDGAPVSIPQWADKTVTIGGTANGATAAIEGSNDGTNWFALTNPQGTAIASGIARISENPLYIRPNLTGGGASTDMDVIICARLNNTLRT